MWTKLCNMYRDKEQFAESIWKDQQERLCMPLLQDKEYKAQAQDTVHNEDFVNNIDLLPKTVILIWSKTSSLSCKLRMFRK